MLKGNRERHGGPASVSEPSSLSVGPGNVGCQMTTNPDTERPGAGGGRTTRREKP
jgi:hypothetical protein